MVLFDVVPDTGDSPDQGYLTVVEHIARDIQSRSRIGTIGSWSYGQLVRGHNNIVVFIAKFRRVVLAKAVLLKCCLGEVCHMQMIEQRR